MSGATHTTDLRTGRTVWQSHRPRLPGSSRLGRSIRTDVLVVGAGISGALAAEALTADGFDVVIVDRRRPVAGSTMASTALLQYEIDIPLTHLARQVGLHRAQRIWRRSRLALEGLRARTRELGIDAALEERDSLYLDGNVLPPRQLEREATARRLAGFEVAFLSAAEVRARFGFRGRSAILGFDNLVGDPVRLAAGYLRAAVGRGARLYSLSR
ncbi:MAG: FAD-dependent oxidoreductase [Vicinamibacterales bacterium]